MAAVSDYLHAKAARNRIPLGGTFELSPVCNFACRMCYVRKTPAQIKAEGKSLIPWQQWLALGKTCREKGMLFLLLTGGEPFLYPNFRELYTELHKLGLVLYINTNGTLIDEETVSWLKQYAPGRVNITLYGASPETYQKICGHADGYHRAMNAIRMLKDAGIPVVINASMIPENAEDLENILAIGRELELNVRMATYMFPPMRRDKEEEDSRFTPEESARMALRKSRFLLDDKSYSEYLRRQLDTVCQPASDDDWGESQEEYMKCRAGRSSFWVAWDGTMTACGMLPFPVEVYPFREEFDRCWQRLTNAVRATVVMRGCAGCPHKEICRPCVAMLHAETGDINQKAPYMCRMAQCAVELMEKEWEEYNREQQA